MYTFYNNNEEIKWSDKTSFKTLDPNDYSNIGGYNEHNVKYFIVINHFKI